MRITIRDYKIEDIVAQIEYFTSATDEYLDAMGVNVPVIRQNPLTTERTIENLKLPVKERVLHNYAIEVDGALVGLATFMKIKRGECAEMHGHIYNAENRKAGVASAILLEVLKRAFETFDLKLVICEPAATNRGPNALLQKFGIQPVATYEAKAERILRDRIVNRYEITRSHLKLSSNSS